MNGPQKQGFRAIILSPTRELAKQTYRECLRLSENYGFRVHIISKINQALSKYGPKSSQKFGTSVSLVFIFILILFYFIYIFNFDCRYINYHTKKISIFIETGTTCHFPS